MTYTWSTFNLNDALNGALVGIGGSTTPDDISKVAGTLVRTNVVTGYKVVINGKTAYLDNTGKVVQSVPSGAFTVNQQMYIATATITETVGNDINITRSGSDPGYGTTATIENIEPRDTFATQILSAMLVHAGNPETFDDATISMYTRAAYRWAQGMMDAAANTRHGQSLTPGTSSANVNTNDLQSNTDKLLNNIVVSMQRTDKQVTEGGNTVYAERVINPTLNDWLEDYIDDGNGGTVGLKDLIDAIGQGGGGGTGGTVQIGDEGLGRSRAYPFYISNSDESKYAPYAIYQYRSKGEAESDGWTFDSVNNVWQKDYYNDVSGSYTDESAKALPTWKNVIKISIVEMADLIDAINDVADAIRNQ